MYFNLCSHKAKLLRGPFILLLQHVLFCVFVVLLIKHRL